MLKGSDNEIWYLCVENTKSDFMNREYESFVEDVKEIKSSSEVNEKSLWEVNSAFSHSVISFLNSAI